MLYNDFQIAETAFTAGFPASSIPLAVSIALAESGGHTDIVNVAGNHPASRDRGLWQINSYYHPEVSDAQAFDPARCASAALVISNHGRNWTPWATYTSGAYLRYLHQAEIAAALTTKRFVLRRMLRPAEPFMFGVDVAALQHDLRLPARQVDGVFGHTTTAAVMMFQENHHLTPDAVVGPATCAALEWSYQPAGG